MSYLSSRIQSISPSTTVAFTQKALALKAQGVDVVSFSVGEPDFDTPTHIVQAAKDALDQGVTRYTPAAGLPELRQLVAQASAKQRGIPCDEQQVIITVGAKHAIYEFFLATLNPGDQVIVPSPYWVSYPDQVKLAGGEPIIVEASPQSGWILKPDDLLPHLCGKTKAIILNSPSNPTGSMYSKQEMQAIVDFAVTHDLWILSDEIYGELVYDGAKHYSPLSLAPKDFDKIFVIDGVSKTYAMTGWRIGWGIGHPEVVSGMIKLQGQSTNNPASVAQAATIAALQGPTTFLNQWLVQYQKRRDTMVAGLNKIPGVSCRCPQGAFYVLPDFSNVISKMGASATDITLAYQLLEQGRVVPVPGSGFGVPDHLRFSYATSMDAIEEGIRRIHQVVSSI